MKQAFLFLALLFWTRFLLAQEPDVVREPKVAVCMDVFGHNYGLGLGLDFWKLSGKKAITAHAQISSFKDRHETKINSVYDDQGGKSFIYDKKNYFYSVSAVVGMSKEVLARSQNNRVGIRVGGALGIALGMLKPYYVQVAIPTSGGKGEIREMPYDNATLNFTDIYGEGDYFLGVSEMKFVPGLSARGSCMFDFSQNLDYIRGIELFLFADIYPKKIEILDAGKNNMLFLGAGLSIQIGNTW